jgi:uncharacterized protein YabN with tetrapyrrole methylase and pyrophosphatase domain
MTKTCDYFVADLFKRLKTEHPLSIMFAAQDLSREVGFDFKSIDLVMDKVEEENEELREAYEGRADCPDAFEDEIGDCFFSLVNLVRHAGLNSEEILRKNCIKYLLRCQFIEAQLEEEGKNWAEIPLEDIYRRWKDAKPYVHAQLEACINDK